MNAKISALFRDREAGRLDDESFHDALALAIPLDCSIKNETQLAHLPARVRTFYAAWQTSADLLNGGFAQAAYNNPHLFGDASLGFLELDLPEQAALIGRAKKLVDEGHANFETPKGGAVFVSVKEADRAKVLPSVKKLAELGFTIKATGGNHAYFESKGVASAKINKVLEGRPHVVDAIKNGDIQLILNTTESRSSESDSKSIRQTAVMQKVPYYTTLPGIISAVKAIAAHKADTIEVRPLQDYF